RRPAPKAKLVRLNTHFPRPLLLPLPSPRAIAHRRCRRTPVVLGFYAREAALGRRRSPPSSSPTPILAAVRRCFDTIYLGREKSKEHLVFPSGDGSGASGRAFGRRPLGAAWSGGRRDLVGSGGVCCAVRRRRGAAAGGSREAAAACAVQGRRCRGRRGARPSGSRPVGGSRRRAQAGRRDLAWSACSSSGGRRAGAT
ncbi:unnamed protein product, partial [Urochloa humidicola]